MEFKRTLLSKSYIWLVVVLLLLNVWIFLYQNSDSNEDFRFFSNMYNTILDDFEGVSWQTGYDKCVQMEDEITQQIVSGTCEGNDEIFYKLEIIRELKTQFSHLLGYNDYLDKIQSNAEELQSVNIFSKPGTFAYKNIIKTADDFSDLEGVELSLGHDFAVTKVFADGWLNLFVLIPVFLICGLFFSERKEGLYSLVYSTPGGRRKLAVKRMIILFLSSAITVILFFGLKIVLNAWMYQGFGEFDRSIQSIPMFYNLPLKLTVGEFWAVFLAVKIFSVFLIGLLLWCVMSFSDNLSFSICVMGIIIGVEFACTLIPSSSFFAVFRYANFFSYINYLPVLTRYLNISILGILISGNQLVCMLLPLLITTLAICSIVIAGKRHPVKGNHVWRAVSEKVQQRVSAVLSGGTLFLQELKKIFICRKGILIIFVLFVLLSQMGVPARNESPLDMYMEFYEQKYAGEITENTITALENELENSHEEDRTAALKLLIARAETASEGNWLFPPAPYEALFTPQRYHHTVALIVLLFIVLLISPIGSQERQADLTYLLYSTPAGRGKLWLNKQFVILFCSVLIWTLVYGTELWGLSRTYGSLSYFEAPASSLQDMNVSELPLTLGETLILLYILRLLLMISVAEICFCISGLCKRNTNSILGCCSLIIVPAGLAAIGSTVGKKISLLLPLSGVDLLPSVYPFIVIMTIGCLAMVFSLWMNTNIKNDCAFGRIQKC